MGGKKAKHVGQNGGKICDFECLHEEGFSYLADNAYIHSGYRLHYSLTECFQSMFQLHNETFNVWTHLIGSFLFLGLIVYILSLNWDVEMSLKNIQQPPPLPHAPFVLNGLHTAKIYRLDVLEHKSEQQCIAPPVVHQHYEVARLIFQQNLIRLTSLKQFLLQNDTLLHTHLTALRNQLQTLQDNLQNLENAWFLKVTLLGRLTSLKDQLSATVQQFHTYLLQHHSLEDTNRVATPTTIINKHEKKATNIILKEYHSVVDSLENGLQILSSDIINHNVASWPLIVFLSSAVICLSFSAIFHLLYVYSPKLYFILSRLDYAGIAVLIAGSFYPLIYYAFYCHPWVLNFYLSAISIMSILTTIMSLIPSFGTPQYLLLRTGVFISLGCFGVIPMVHLIWKFGLFDPHVTIMIGPLLLMAVLYLSGAVIYSTKFPERFYPGRFDVWFSSHQLWHVCVVAAAFVHFLNAIQHYEWRWATQCDSA